MSKSHLDRARHRKNDEYYTLYEDIERELQHYGDHLRGKKIYLNCDGAESNFYKYFMNRFEKLGLESVTVTGVNSKEKIIYYGNGREERTKMREVGDFRSDECLALMDESDVVITNPPFSLARKKIELMLEKGVDFIIMGTILWATYSKIAPIIADGTIKMGVNKTGGHKFLTPGGAEKSISNIVWYTTFDHGVQKPFLDLKEDWDIEDYERYDEHPDVLNVDFIKDIPKGYKGFMGVPVTIYGRYNPDQIKIVENEMRLHVGGKAKFTRVLIELV